MDIFGGKCLKDIIHFYDKKGNKTMIGKIHELIQQIEEDLDPDFKYVEVESSEEEYITEKEELSLKKDADGFYSFS